MKLAQKKGFRQLKGFVNGVLRNAARKLPDLSFPGEEEPVRHLSVRYSMPEWIVEDWLEAYGRETAERMLASCYEERRLRFVQTRAGSPRRSWQSALRSAAWRWRKRRICPMRFR